MFCATMSNCQKVHFRLFHTYTTGHFNLDVAYQYSATDGEFAPFMNYWDDVTSEDDNVANVVNVSNKRHQLMVTLGYKF